MLAIQIISLVFVKNLRPLLLIFTFTKLIQNIELFAPKESVERETKIKKMKTNIYRQKKETGRKTDRQIVTERQTNRKTNR